MLFRCFWHFNRKVKYVHSQSCSCSVIFLIVNLPCTLVLCSPFFWVNKCTISVRARFVIWKSRPENPLMPSKVQSNEHLLPPKMSCPCTVEPQYNKGARDWQNTLAIMRFHYIVVLFQIFYYYWGKLEYHLFYQRFCYIGS